MKTKIRKTRHRVSAVPPAILAKFLSRPFVGSGRLGYGRTKSLTEQEISEIREQWETRKATQIELAVRYKTSQATISKLVRGEPLSLAAVAVEAARHPHSGKKRAA